MRTFCAVVAIGCLGCLGTYFTTTYSQLFAMRTLTGVAIGGAPPLVYSLLGDLFPTSRRSLVGAVAGLAQGFGVGVGQGIASAFGRPPSADWRSPFLVVALPALGLTAVVLALVPEPRRGGQEAALRGAANGLGGEGLSADWAKLSIALRTRTVLLVFLQGLPGCVPWGVIGVYLNDFLLTDRALSAGRCGAILFSFGLGTWAGTLGGGAAGQAAYNRSRRTLPLLMAASTLAAIPPFLGVINAPLASPAAAAAAGAGLFCGGAAATVTGANIRAVLLNVTQPEVRGAIFAIYNLFDDLGRGLGPAFCAVLVALRGRVFAFNVCVSMWGANAALLAAMAWTLEADEDAMQARLGEALRARGGGEWEGEGEDGEVYGEHSALLTPSCPPGAGERGGSPVPSGLLGGGGHDEAAQHGGKGGGDVQMAARLSGVLSSAEGPMRGASRARNAYGAGRGGGDGPKPPSADGRDAADDEAPPGGHTNCDVAIIRPQ